MSELKRDYWSESLVCVTGIVKIDRREIAAIVISPVKKRIVGAGSPPPVEECNNLDIHLKSGTIFTATEWDVNTVANLYLVESPVEGVKTVPYNNKSNGVDGVCKYCFKKSKFTINRGTEQQIKLCSDHYHSEMKLINDAYNNSMGEE